MKKTILFSVIFSVIFFLPSISRSQKAVLYEHRDFGGRSEVFDVNLEVLQLRDCGFWEHWGDGPSGVYNDDVSSIVLPPGYGIQVFVDENFQGASITFRESCVYVGDFFNDKITSFRFYQLGN